MSHGVNISQKSDKQLADLQTAILKEQSLRRRLDASPEKIEHAIAEYQKATGKGQGEPWTQPTTALDAYRAGAEVEHEGQCWVSTHSGNVHAPGQSGWRLKAEVDPETGKEIPPPYVAPSGAHDSYNEGETITWTDGNIYAAARDGVAHSPAEYAPDWILVEEEPDPDPEPPEDDEEPVDPDEPGDEDDDDQDDGEADEEPAEPELDEWAPDQDYMAGDELTYDGAQYRVLQSHRSAAHWLPSAVPALYERL